MLEKIDLTRSVPKAEYERRLPGLQNHLYELERDVSEADIPVATLFEGWAAAGKATAIRTMTQRLDPRGCVVVPITPPRTHETHYPWLWRFWQKIPAYGQIVVYDTSWYRRVLIERFEKVASKREWEAAYRDIADFEQQLAADGYVILKFWLHISREEQAKRFKALLKNPLTSYQVSDEDRSQHRLYRKYLGAVEDMLARTDTAWAPWVIVEATDGHHARLKILETTVATLEAALAGRIPEAPAATPSPADRPAHA